ncbi:hypothetical protein SK803_16015 [Lentzea sp. BCCO 10_0856]|uniref:Uncharacterized protein n=1 Tax=Lentzea miocenica TaxID=3095431 RepID=A0ABU4T0N7_9PSEU|nr:hypothetical protein [Lentzea sp. BCCO 10_0856]MDX8031731.1 hypothetical protein [Lentzea sp. BCCO 10_0856]
MDVEEHSARRCHPTPERSAAALLAVTVLVCVVLLGKHSQRRHDAGNVLTHNGERRTGVAVDRDPGDPLEVLVEIPAKACQ